MSSLLRHSDVGATQLEAATPFFLANPVDRKFLVTNAFNAPRPYANGLHEGIDLRALENGRAVDILAAQRGVVDRIRTGVNTGYGNYVRVRHDWDDGTTWVTWYAHLATIDPGIREGTFVQIGDRLGLAGTTGNSTGVHLHLTLQHLGYGLKGYVLRDVVDPRPYFSDRDVSEMDQLSYIADLTVPDGSTVTSGIEFLKEWRVRNTGTQPWTDGYALHFDSGEQMAGPDAVALPPLQPGDFGVVTVPLVAPQLSGRYRSTWKSRNAAGEPFGPGLYADLIVSAVPRREGTIFVSDETIPDGTVIEPGATFLKTWRVRNSGNAAWDIGYSLSFHTGKAMGGPDYVVVPPARPGSVVDVSVTLTAPDEPGTYRSIWRVRNPVGKQFGDLLFAEIVVERRPDLESARDAAICLAGHGDDDRLRVATGEHFHKRWRLCNTGRTSWDGGYALAHVGDHPMGGGAAARIPTALPGETIEVVVPLTAPTRPGHHVSSWQMRAPGGRLFGPIVQAAVEVVRLGTEDNARFVADVTVPDGMTVQPGQLLTKTWRVANNGTSAWVPGYSLRFVADEQMEAPVSVALPLALPGEEVEVTVTLRVPEVSGRHRSTWRPRSPEGQLFGHFLYADIEVEPPSAPGSSQDNAKLVAHVTIPNGTEFEPGAPIRKTWAIRNTGATVWDDAYELVHVGGDSLDGPSSVPVPAAEPGSEVNVTVNLTAPPAPGQYMSRWRLRNADGKLFGPTFFVSIKVVQEKEEMVDLLDYLRGDGRLYEMKHIFDTAAGMHIGQQRVQTQGDGQRFFTVKNEEWEEMWVDGRFIYRGTDTSPGNGNFYTLMEGNRYGSPWVPRQFAVGKPYRRSPTVVSRRKADCNVNFQLSGTHVTWIILERIVNRLRLPNVEGSQSGGLSIDDVAVLAAFNDVNGRPASQPFERYYYAKGFGLVMWEGIEVDHIGQSFVVEIHAPGVRPNNVREQIPCLERLMYGQS